MSVGKKYTDFSMFDIEAGKKKKLSKIARRNVPVVVLVYNASVECNSAVQALEEVAFGHSHVKCCLYNFVDSETEINNYLKEQNIRKCVSYSGKMPKGYSIREGALPYHIVIDEDGTVVHASEDTTADYIKLIA